MIDLALGTLIKKTLEVLIKKKFQFIFSFTCINNKSERCHKNRKFWR